MSRGGRRENSPRPSLVTCACAFRSVLARPRVPFELGAWEAQRVLGGSSAGEGGFVPGGIHMRVGVHELSGPRGSVLVFGLAWRVRKQSRFFGYSL